MVYHVLLCVLTELTVLHLFYIFEDTYKEENV